MLCIPSLVTKLHDRHPCKTRHIINLCAYAGFSLPPSFSFRYLEDHVDNGVRVPDLSDERFWKVKERIMECEMKVLLSTGGLGKGVCVCVCLCADSMLS